MPTLILKTVTRYLLPLMLLISVFVFVRGHNATGGGFVGGLVAASAIVLYAMAFDVAAARHALRAAPHQLLGMGLLVALGSGLPALLVGQPFMSGQWISFALPGLGPLELGTPLLFDFGVYLVVLGMAVAILLTVLEL